MAHPTDKTTSAPIYQGAPRAGLRNVGSYQVSGHPYVTGSVIKAGEEVRVQFPNVTKKEFILFRRPLLDTLQEVTITFL